MANRFRLRPITQLLLGYYGHDSHCLDSAWHWPPVFFTGDHHLVADFDVFCDLTFQ